MSSSSIGQVAARTGVATSALRFYERLGLISPAARTPAGHRLYDDRDVARVEFITRAKRLGCTLEEVHDLVAVWDGERCGPVQQHLHRLVTEKLDASRNRIAELQAFDDQLRVAARQLAADPVDGPCGDDCACHRASATAVRPTPGSPARVVCSLDDAELPGRVADWTTALGAVRGRVPLDGGGLRLELGADADLARLAHLIVAERRCCPFFAFTLTVDQRGAAVEVRAPDGSAELVDALFGTRTAHLDDRGVTRPAAGIPGADPEEQAPCCP